MSQTEAPEKSPHIHSSSMNHIRTIRTSISSRQELQNVKLIHGTQFQSLKKKTKMLVCCGYM